MENKNQFTIVGYSGHSYVCLEIAIQNSFEPIGYYDKNLRRNNPYNLEYLGSETYSVPLLPVFIGIGDNIVRKKVFDLLLQNNCNLSINLIHNKSIVASSSSIGLNILVAAGAIINSFTKIGNCCILNTGSIIEHECKIGDFVHVAPGAVLAGNVSVGDRTFIGANSVVKQGVKIGKDVTVGAGTVVLFDIPDNATVVGNPGKIIKTKL